MGWCSDGWRHEEKGRDAARYGPRSRSEHRTRMENARHDWDTCDAAYARGFEREEQERQDRRREEEEDRRREEQQAAYEERQRLEDRWEAEQEQEEQERQEEEEWGEYLWGCEQDG